MGDGRHHFIEYVMVRTGSVVHARDPVTGVLGCNGRYAQSQLEAVFEPSVVSCLWCITGILDSRLRWFKWGDGT